MVALHEQHLRAFLDSWVQARASGVGLPQVADPDYESYDTLLRHVLGAARGYMTWICEQLGLPDPAIEPPPGVDRIAAEAQDFMEHVIERWRTPLVSVPEERFESTEYPSSWTVLYCIDAMLEHAVMHPVRHRFQLIELMEKDLEEKA